MSEHDAEEPGLSAQKTAAGEQAHHLGSHPTQAISMSVDATPVAPVRPSRRKRARAADRHHSWLLYGVSRILLEAGSLEATAEPLLRAIGKALHWDLGTWWMLEPQAGTLRYQASWHASRVHALPFLQMSQQRRFSSGEGLPGRVWATGEAAWVSDVLTDANFPRHLAAAQSGLHAGCAFPLHGKQDILGVIEFFSRRTVAPDEALLRTLFTVGQQIGQFLERLSAEEAVRASEARKAAMLHSALDAVITMDQEGRVLEWNPAAERLFGYARQAAMGQPMAYLIIPPALREQHARGLARYLHTGQATLLDQRVEVTGMRADGRLFPVELTITRIDLPGPVLFTGYLRDLTERKQAEQELATQSRALEYTNSELRRQRDELLLLNAALEQAHRGRQFFSTMSHELRTPLASIIGFSQLLLADVPTGGWSPQQRTNLERILKNGQHLLSLLNDVLELEKIEAGRMEVTYAQVDPRDLLTWVVEETQSIAMARNLVLRAEVEDRVDSLETSLVKLRQILLNLVSNALKFTEQGEVTVSARRVDADHLAFAVQDTGIGIPADVQERIFEAFYQVDGSYTRKAGGTGLGLSIVRHLTTLLGGTIELTSAPGQGSTFTVILPIKVVHFSIKSQDVGIHIRREAQPLDASEFR